MALQETFETQGNWLFKKRTYIPFIVLAAGISWHVFLLHSGGRISVNTWWLDLAFMCIGFAGLGIRIFTIGFKPKGTSGRNTSRGQIAESLNTSGIYSVVRHPLYLGNFLMWLAVILIMTDLWFTLFMCAFFWIYYERIMYAEEQFLRGKFGQSYIDWSNKTPAIIPDFSHYEKNVLSFSFRNALKREYNGFFSLVFLMTLFRVVGFAITTGRFYLDKPWIIIFSTAFIMSVIIRILKKFTRILDVEGR